MKSAAQVGTTRLGAFITTMNRPEVLKATLACLMNQSRPPDHVLVVDNGISRNTREVVAGFPTEWVAYQAMSDNLGPAGAAAYALERLAGEGNDWIYWGDDDNPPRTPDTIERLLKVADTAGSEVGAVGAVGARWDWTSGRTRRLLDNVLTGLVGVDVVGGGQQLILRRDAVLRVGLPNAQLFFGFEEFEYCLRIRAAGYRLLVSGELMAEYRASAGHLDWTPPRSIRPSLPSHAIWRRYYSTRNYIFVMRHTFRRPDLARAEAMKAVARACLSWGRGTTFGLAFTALQLRGIVDGYVGKMGRTVSPTAKYV